MASTKLLTLYLMVIVFFNFFAGQFAISQESSDFDLEKYLVVQTVADKIILYSAPEGSFLNLGVNLLKIPFLLLNYVAILLVILSTGVSLMPPIVNILMFVPLSLLVVFQYVLPMFRGN